MTPDLPKLVDIAAMVADFEFRTTVAEREPVFITKDGSEKFVLVSVRYYDELLVQAGVPRAEVAD